LNFTTAAALSIKVTRSFRQQEDSCDRRKSGCEGYASAVIRMAYGPEEMMEVLPLARACITVELHPPAMLWL